MRFGRKSFTSTPHDARVGFVVLHPASKILDYLADEAECVTR